MSRWSKEIAEFKNSLSIMNRLWLFVTFLGCVATFLFGIRRDHEISMEWGLKIFGMFIVIGLFDMCRQIVLGLGYLLLSIEEKIDKK